MEGSESRQAFNCLLGEVLHTCVAAGEKNIVLFVLDGASRLG